jgi:hypothetical protein
MGAIGGSRTKISALQGRGFAVYLSILCIVSARRETRGRKQRLNLVIDSLCKFLRAQNFAFRSSRLKREDRDRDRPREWPAGQFPSVALQRTSTVWSDLQEHKPE